VIDGERLGTTAVRTMTPQPGDMDWRQAIIAAYLAIARTEAGQADERTQTQRMVHRLAQAYALIHALQQVGPSEAAWQSIRDIPASEMQRAYALVRGSGGDIEPSEEDLAAARRDLAESE